jgi:6-pyruvoyltetrahydropterin/6-carboxytetrahydropterin synthase
MSRKSFSIQVHKDYLKFSAAHFLIFEDGTPERLHGHNYKVFVEVQTELDEVGLVIDFKRIKPLVVRILEQLDERFLVPGEHPGLSVNDEDADSYVIRYQEKRYLIPKEDVLILPINNSSAENLAAWIADRLDEQIEEVANKSRIHSLSVGVEETPGQRGTCSIRYRESAS